MIASTGTGARDPETNTEEVPNRTPTAEVDPEDPPKRHYLTRTIVDGDNFEAGQYGTYASIFMLIIGMVGSVLGLNYAPSITLSSWTTDCKEGYFSACKSSSAVLRFSFALSLVFAIQLIGTTVFTRFFDYFWIIKYLLFAALVIIFYFLNAEIFDLNGYAWYARVAAFFYLIIQQIILLDLAYTWNEQWVKWSEEDQEHGYGTVWLVLLVMISFFFIGGSITVIGLMYWQFGHVGCSDTLVILSLTVILCSIAAVLQIFVSDSGSILTTSIITAYATYIAYSAVTLNPNATCNPTLSTGYQTISQAIGMGFTLLSLLWAGITTLSKIKGVHHPDSDTPIANIENEPRSPYDTQGLRPILQEISLVFLLISSYFAMVLTNWATIQSNFSIQSAKQGTAAMWIQAAGQWIAIVFYIWSLAAPKLFPDRDFGGK